MNRNLKSLVTGYTFNFSDHLPILFSLAVRHSTDLSNDNSRATSIKSVVKEFRWDKGDLQLYYELTSHLLQKIYHQFPCLEHEFNCSEPYCHQEIEIYCNEIVHCLQVPAEKSIPRIPVSALKHYWSAYTR